MPPHPHRGGFNIEPCIPCEGKRLSHTETDAEKQSENKKQRLSQAVLWRPKNAHTHIKSRQSNKGFPRTSFLLEDCASTNLQFEADAKRQNRLYCQARWKMMSRRGLCLVLILEKTKSAYSFMAGIMQFSNSHHGSRGFPTTLDAIATTKSFSGIQQMTLPPEPKAEYA